MVPAGQTRLSILIPVYNEEEFVAAAIQRLLETDLGPGIETELVAVDDGSTDGSAEALDQLQAELGGKLKVIRHERNRGKGAAVRTALQNAALRRNS